MMNGMRPLHPRAVQGIALMMVGVTIGVLGVIVHAAVDLRGDGAPVAAYGLWVVAGFLLLAGVIIYAASPARVDWRPRDVELFGDRTRR